MLCRTSSYQEGTFLSLIKHSITLDYLSIKDIFTGYAKQWELDGVEVYEKNKYNRLYNFFRANMCFDSKGTIHISFGAYEYMPVNYNNVNSVGGNYYLIGYLKSEDSGSTWCSFKNKKYSKYPLIPVDLDLIDGFADPSKNSKFYETSNLVLYQDKVFLLYHEFDDNSKMKLVEIKDDQLIKEKLNYRKNFMEDIYANSESSFMIDDFGNKIFAIATVNKSDYLLNHGFGKESTKIRLMINKDFISDIECNMTWFPNFMKRKNNNMYFIFQSGNGADNELYIGGIKKNISDK